MGMDTGQLILAAIGILGWAYLVWILWVSREGIFWIMKAVSWGVLVFVATQLVLRATHRPEAEVVVGGYVAAALAVALTPRRSRYIPAAVKRRVIARDLKGKKYNPRKHHIDHIWPFSKGGSSAPENLRVISRKENLRKGAKKPRLRDWF